MSESIRVETVNPPCSDGQAPDNYARAKFRSTLLRIAMRVHDRIAESLILCAQAEAD